MDLKNSFKYYQAVDLIYIFISDQHLRACISESSKYFKQKKVCLNQEADL